jgi:glycosyltransferase involved in cell wall biosynthesis
MKICYIGDAQNIHLQKWARFFAKNENEIFILSPKLHKFKEKNIKVYLLKNKNKIVLLKSLFSVFETRKLIKKIKPDIVHGHFVSVYGFPTVFSGDHPKIISCWGTDILIHPDKSLLTRLYVLISFKKADIIHSPSKDCTEKIKSFGIEQKKNIEFPEGTNLKLFNPEKTKEFPEEIKEWKNNFIVLSTRAFEPVYNIEQIINAIPLVIKKNNKFRFVFIGQGYLKNKMIELSKKLGIEKYIKFLGKIPNKKMPLFYHNAKIYLSASLSDSTSVALNEAMACGCFPILSDIEANRPWIKNGKTGFLFPLDNPKILAEKIISAYKNQKLIKNAKNINWNLIKKEADFDKNHKMMEKIYYDLIARYNPK